MTSKAAFTNAVGAGWRWLETLQPDAPVEFRAITIVPLRAPKQADPPWLLLHEALAADSVEVTEISEQGSVPTLHVTNRDSRDVLLLDGEELVGAKQNRVLNTTVLVRAHSTLEVPVSCVEQGRWRYTSQRFAASAHSLYASIRLKKTAQVHASLRLRQSFSSDQGAIWSDLGERAKALKVKSSAMAGAFAAREPELDEYTAAFAPRPDQVGALVYGGRAWWGMDVLPSPRLFKAAWPRMLSGYVLDALSSCPEGRPDETGAERLEAFLGATVEIFPSVGAGDDCRIAGPGVVGAALIVDGVVAHAMAFPAGR
jgi:hypothetical protein